MLALGGCGFRPLYGPNGAGGQDPSVRGELGAIRVAVIQERFGQLIRRQLYARMGQSVGGPSQPVYELRVGPGVQAEGVGIQRDGTSTRVRYIGTANWLLVRIGTPPETLASGVERAVEAYNIPPNQFFASDSSRDAAELRLAEVLSELVVTRVAVDFRRRAAGLTGAALDALPPVPGEARPPGLGEPVGLPGLGGTIR